MMRKTCSKCQEEKDESEFYKDKRHKDGLRSNCKECQSQYERERYAIPENKEIKKEYRARPENKEKQRQYNTRPENKEKHNQSVRKYATKPENKERKKQNNKEYNARPENKKIRNQKDKERCQTDFCYKLRKRISSAIWKGLKKNCGSKHGSSILSKLPYSMQQLKQHIESLFESWMNWENHGPYNPNRKTWQIDHIKPHSSFHYENMDCEEFKKCWALSNLRPLESLANIKKGNKK